MRFAPLFLSVALVVSGSNCSALPRRAPADDYNPWQFVKTPTTNATQPQGFYSAGCLDGAQALPIDGTGYQAVRLVRNRHWGTPELIDFLQRLGNQSMDEKVGVLLIADMSQPRGGPMPYPAHNSHQTGLDVDVWFLLNPDAQFRPLTPEERESIEAVSFVDLDHQVIKKELWKPEHVKMLEIASRQPDTERIFVNPAIKKELCDTIPARKRGWLRKLRPWFGHDDHFHVRLKCPAHDSNCTVQDPVPVGDGCDQLAWWFSPEAHQAEQNASSAPRPMPKLPEICDSILKQPLF